MSAKWGVTGEWRRSFSESGWRQPVWISGKTSRLIRLRRDPPSRSQTVSLDTPGGSQNQQARYHSQTKAHAAAPHRKRNQTSDNQNSKSSRCMLLLGNDRSALWLVCEHDLGARMRCDTDALTERGCPSLARYRQRFGVSRLITDRTPMNEIVSASFRSSA